MGFAIRNFEAETQDSNGVTKFGSHSRHGHFDMILQTGSYETSYWGLYVSGAGSLQGLGAATAMAFVLSQTIF